MKLFPPSLLLRLCLLFSLLLPLQPVLAAATSPLRFQRLGSLGNDELSILSLLQDRQGFIWIGTQAGGLYRYNGYQAVKYTNSPHSNKSLPHDRVTTLFEDARGVVWAGTQGGLARFNPETNDFTRVAPKSGPNNHLIVKQIISDGKDGVWIATWGGLQHFDPATGKFDQYAHQDGVPDSLGSNDLNAIALDEKGGVWAGTWPSGIDYLAPGSKSFKHFRIDEAAKPDPKLNIVRALYYDKQRTLWIGTEKGVLTWDSSKPWATREAVDAPHTRINYLYADHQDTVWAGTLAAGLLRWDKGSKKTIVYAHRANDPHSLPSDHIRAVLQDRGGMLWIASFTDGISLVNLNSQGFQRYIPFDDDPNNPQANNSLTALEGAPGGRVWLGQNTGFSLFEPGSGKVIRSYRAAPGKPGALSNDIIYSLYQQPDGPLWVGTSAGLNRLDKPDGPFSVVHFSQVTSDFINSIAPGQGDYLWLGTAGSVIHYNTKTGASKSYTHIADDSNSRSVAGATSVVEDRQGRVWMGSEWNGGGLDMLDPRTGLFTHFLNKPADPKSLSDDNVSTLYLDRFGRMWVGTAKGLNEILTDPNGRISFRSFATPDSVGHVKILSIRGDKAGHIWLSTASGLIRLEPDTGKVSRFTTVDGLSEGFSVAASYAAPDGTIYFGGVKGMTAVHSASVKTVSHPPQVAITDISVFNRSLKDAKPNKEIELLGAVTAPQSLRLAYEQSVFSIEFAALHYTDPDKNQYAYRLVGFDRNWVETDAAHRVATYTNLDPNDYEFQVKAANDQGVWSEKATSLRIRITPPFWSTWWFRVIAAVGSAGLMFLAYHLRVNRLKRQRVELQALVTERTRALEESNRKLAALSTTDSLTGITNRRGFDVALNGEWRRAKRGGQGLALCMLDVDHFKHYNDHYGHPAGDQCLRTVATVIAAHARRTSDLAARYGGEEFAFLAPNTSLEDALQIAQEICLELERIALPHSKSPYGVVTISVGVAAVFPGDGHQVRDLIERADQALYRAKLDGRNRAITYGTPETSAALS